MQVEWKVFKRSLILTILALVVQGCAAPEPLPPGACISRDGRVNLCEVAKAVERDAAADLPVDLGDGDSIVAVTAQGRRVTLVGRVDLTRQQFTETGISREDWNRLLIPKARRSFCRPGNAARFIRHGGEIEVALTTTDRFEFMRTVIDSCR